MKRASWKNLSSLHKLKDGEAARVLWPTDATQPAGVPYREGFVSRVYDRGGEQILFRWDDDPLNRIGISSPRQVEVMR